MYFSILVTVGESKIDFLVFKELLNKHYPDSHLPDFLDVRLPYVMIEKIPYGSQYQELVDDLNKNGYTVWVVTEPKGRGIHEVIFYHKTNHTDGIKKLQKFDSRPQRTLPL